MKLSHWQVLGLVQVVKQGPQRTVYRVSLPEGTIYIKHSRPTDWTARLRESIRPSKARLEFFKARTLAARGLTVAVPLAVGVQQKAFGGESFLVTAGLDDTSTLNDFLIRVVRTLPPRLHARVRQGVARTLGAWVAGLHEAGVWQGDFHPGNILVRWDKDSTRSEDLHYFLVDLPSVHVGRPLDARASGRTLAVFSHWFLLRSGRTDRLRFWQAYCQGRSAAWRGKQIGDVRACRNLAAPLEEQSRQSNLAFWADRDRRCRQTNRYYRRIRSHGMVGHAWHELNEACLKKLLADPAGPFHKPEAILLKKGRSSTVAEVTVVVNGRPRQAILKRFNVTGWRDPLASLVRTQPAIRSWVQGHGLRERGLPTARPLAVWHRRRLGLLWEGYLLTEKVEQARELNQAVNDLAALPAKQRQTRIRTLITETADLIRQLHLRLYSHRDLKASNILVVPDAGPIPDPLPEGFSTLAGFLQLLQPRLVFIDLVGVEGPGRLGFDRKTQNLARLHVSFRQCALVTRTDKLRFLRAYLQWHLKGKTGWKCWWHAIDQATKAKIARNQKTGRVLG